MTTVLDTIEAAALDDFLLEVIRKRKELYEFNLAYDNTASTRLMVKEFQSFANVRFDPHPSIYITCSGDKKVLTKAFRLLRAAGYSHTASPPKKGENTWCVYWNHQDNNALKVFLYFTSSVCRRVQVGTKTAEVPIYEMQCGEDISQVIPQLTELGGLLPSIEEEFSS